MSSSISNRVEMGRSFKTEADQGSGLREAMALSLFRDLQEGGLIPADARPSDAIQGSDYRARLTQLIEDADGDGRLDVDVGKLTGSGLLSGAPSAGAVSAAISGAPRPELSDRYLPAPAVGLNPLSWGSCNTGARTEAVRALSRGMVLEPNAAERVAASPEEAQRVADEAIAGAQFLGQRQNPLGARDLLLRTGATLLDAGRLDQAEAVYGELSGPSYRDLKSGVGALSSGALAEERLQEIEQRRTHLSPEELAAFGEKGGKYLGKVQSDLDAMIADNQATIERALQDGRGEGAITAQRAQNAQLRQDQIDLVAAARAGAAYGEDLLTLGNVVQNEAGKCGDEAKRAVAFAWLNHTDGEVRGPRDEYELSHYQDYPERWDNLSKVGKVTLAGQLPDFLAAANARFSAADPVAADPTGGATHWVSPQGLPRYSGDPKRYSRSYGSAENRSFPIWARDPQADAAVVAEMKAREALWSNYAEIVVPGVPGDEFLFYTGVR